MKEVERRTQQGDESFQRVGVASLRTYLGVNMIGGAGTKQSLPRKCTPRWKPLKSKPENDSLIFRSLLCISEVLIDHLYQQQLIVIPNPCLSYPFTLLRLLHCIYYHPW